ISARGWGGTMQRTRPSSRRGSRSWGAFLLPVALRIAPRPLEEADPVPVQDAFDCRPVITAPLKHLRQALHAGNRVQVRGRLLPAEAAVEISADRGMPSIAGQLANTVDVIDHAFQANIGLLRRRLASYPAGVQHPCIQGRADDRAASHQPFDLKIGELPLI